MSVASLVGAVIPPPSNGILPLPLPTIDPNPVTPPPPVITSSPPPPPPPPITTTTVAPPPPPPVTSDPGPSTTDAPNPPASTGRPKPSKTKSSGSGASPTPVPGGDGGNGGNSGNGGNAGNGGDGGNNNGGGNSGTIDGSGNSTSGTSSKSIIAPVIGGIAGVLVLAFLVVVFAMRHRKKSKANKRRLDILFDQNGQGQDQVHALGLGAGGAAGGAGAATKRLSMQSSVARPSNVEMSAIGGGPGALHSVHDNSYDNHGGYHHHSDSNGYDYASSAPNPYGGYQEQQQPPFSQQAYDAYDPFYGGVVQPQSLQGGQPQQGGAQLPPAGYYQDNNRTSPAMTYQQPYGGTSVLGSPSVTYSSASPPKSYPPPPPTGISSSPSPRFQNLSPPQAPQGYHKNETVAGDYAGAQSSARNPQVVAGDHVKVPM
ncbi:hypothetical protein BGZ83_005184 [Gryganskiella cystojenkinii]|nr:hypothetical protein BGZ83_005184 [Gryganskiella cystojenkinii]